MESEVKIESSILSAIKLGVRNNNIADVLRFIDREKNVETKYNLICVTARASLFEGNKKALIAATNRLRRTSNKNNRKATEDKIADWKKPSIKFAEQEFEIKAARLAREQISNQLDFSELASKIIRKYNLSSAQNWIDGRIAFWSVQAKHIPSNIGWKIYSQRSLNMSFIHRLVIFDAMLSRLDYSPFFNAIKREIDSIKRNVEAAPIITQNIDSISYYLKSLDRKLASSASQQR